ncbi:hypothetical protein FC093_19035 [Ilyomonas limi]|uniref:BT4734-like N-terminal domain-containing protein n=1 Tax=Ilyomonas limi TaxID=2575867 RepID=A0A4U3KXM1_9BACT|nr:CRISPR-associated primase-polymerase type B [Ilyomonas limi]TKK65847.1 hypothetical protein FC093_19035 [Ilyomonas limi]
MLYFGTAITTPADVLQPIAVDTLHQALLHPKPKTRQLIDQLRVIQTLDKNSYKTQKKLLPYLVCAAFKPAIRRRENFLYIEYFFIDLDGIAGHFDKAMLWRQLVTDSRLVLLFTSPGGDGLKLLYRLQERCRDYGLFSAFYKQFVQHLASRFHLHPVIDTATSDVTRACFISYDEHAYYNAGAAPVDMREYNMEEPETLWHAAQQASTAFEEEKEKTGSEVKRPTTSPGSEVLAAIRQKLNPHYRKPEKKQYYIPPEVDTFIEKITERLKEYQLQLLETSPIHYGRKLRIGTTGMWAEINLFYGSRGFTFVKTTKTGSNSQLADLCVQVLEENLYNSNKAR